MGLSTFRLEVSHGKKVRKSMYDGVDSLVYVSDYRYVKMLAEWKRFLEEYGFPTDERSVHLPLEKGSTRQP